MRRFRILLVPILLVPVSACENFTGHNKARDLASCRMESVKVYPQWGTDESQAHGQGDFVEFCMEAKGYWLTNANGGCPNVMKWAEQNMEVCYKKPLPWES